MRVLMLILAALLAGCVTMQAGIDALNRGDLNAAEADFTQALQRGDPMAWNNLGVVYERRGDMPRALSHYNMAARWGIPIAQQNLAKLGQPIPPADLAANAANQRAANAANAASTLLLMQALQPRPAPLPVPVNCTSHRFGNQVQTSCY